jgi:6-phosphogluconolactonase
MRVLIGDDAAGAARLAADLIESLVKDAIGARQSATVALSGGRTPWAMLGLLARRQLPWELVYVFQTDERVVDASHIDRTWTQL